MCKSGIEQTTECVASTVRNRDKVEFEFGLQCREFFYVDISVQRNCLEMVVMEVFPAIFAKTVESFACRSIGKAFAFGHMHYCHMGFGIVESTVQSVKRENVVLVKIAEEKNVAGTQRGFGIDRFGNG